MLNDIMVCSKIFALVGISKYFQEYFLKPKIPQNYSNQKKPHQLPFEKWMNSKYVFARGSAVLKMSESGRL
jgi:hypothetical protein